MVGGTVIGIIRRENGSTRLHIRANKGEGCCLVEVTEQRKASGIPVKVKLGGDIWLQKDSALWTQKEDGKIPPDARFDVEIPMHGRAISCNCIHMEES